MSIILNKILKRICKANKASEKFLDKLWQQTELFWHFCYRSSNPSDNGVYSYQKNNSLFKRKKSVNFVHLSQKCVIFIVACVAMCFRCWSSGQNVSGIDFILYIIQTSIIAVCNNCLTLHLELKYCVQNSGRKDCFYFAQNDGSLPALLDMIRWLFLCILKTSARNSGTGFCNFLI